MCSGLPWVYERIDNLQKIHQISIKEFLRGFIFHKGQMVHNADDGLENICGCINKVNEKNTGNTRQGSFKVLYGVLKHTLMDLGVCFPFLLSQ